MPATERRSRSCVALTVRTHAALARPTANSTASPPILEAPMATGEHFITFSDAMVRAILDGRKTQTRRLIRAPRGYRVGCYTEGGKVVDVVAVDEDGDPADVEIRCPYGVPGDHLLVREGVAHAGGGLSVYTA